MQAEAGFTTDRRSGTRAATTLRKLPSARPGASEKRAATASTKRVIGGRNREVESGWKVDVKLLRHRPRSGRLQGFLAVADPRERTRDLRTNYY
jgi:hypothetical protein